MKISKKDKFSPVKKMNFLLELIFKKCVLPLIMKYGLPVIDLANSFDIYDEDLYRC